MKQAIEIFNKNKKWFLIGLIVIVCVLPWITTPTVTRLLTITCIYCISSFGLCLIFGMAGMMATGIAAFIGVGAYLAAILSKTYGVPFTACLLIAGFGTALVGVIVCLPILRLTVDFVGMISTAFLNIFLAIVRNWQDVTGGAVGIYAIQRPTFFGYTIIDKKAQFYLMFAFMILCYWLVNNLLNSKVGRGMKGIRDNEIGTIMVGIEARRMKLLTFAVGSFLAGFAGALYATYMGTVTPDNFTFAISTQFVQMCVIGGIGTLPGAIIGTAFITMFPEVVRPLAIYRLGIAGLIMVLMMVFRPQGLVGSRAFAGDQGIMDRIQQASAVRKAKKAEKMAQQETAV